MSVSFEKDHLQNTEIVVAQRSWLLATSRALSEKSIAWHQLRVSSASAPLRSITVTRGIVSCCSVLCRFARRPMRAEMRGYRGRRLPGAFWPVGAEPLWTGPVSTFLALLHADVPIQRFSTRDLPFENQFENN